MTNMPFDQKLAFDEELSIAATSFAGSSLFIGTLTNEPVVIIFKNQTTVPVFIADNVGEKNGTTLAVNEVLKIDCRSNKGSAVNMGFPKGTSFYVTASAGTGNLKISSLYAY